MVRQGPKVACLVVIDEPSRRQSAINDGLTTTRQTMRINAGPSRETIVVSAVRTSLGTSGPWLVVKRREIIDPVVVMASLQRPLGNSRLVRTDHIEVFVLVRPA